MTINEKLATIQTKFKSKKTSYNAFGKYYFRKAEDILEALKPYLLQLSVSITINEKLVEKEPMPMIESTTTRQLQIPKQLEPGSLHRLRTW